ncbi:mitochondrial carrier domain-containing protein [Hypoxylon sp. FL0890]|nr:mitochondrial carrier domain-containing protein [Hypoxylon sp. FL0890]
MNFGKKGIHAQRSYNLYYQFTNSPTYLSLEDFLPSQPWLSSSPTTDAHTKFENFLLNLNLDLDLDLHLPYSSAFFVTRFVPSYPHHRRPWFVISRIHVQPRIALGSDINGQPLPPVIRATIYPRSLVVATLALQPKAFGEGSTAVAKMAQPTIVEPVEDYDYESLPPNFSLTQNMAAGAFAGIAEHTVMYPIDAIKTRMQIINPSANGVYKGMIESTMRIASGEGVLKLWRGMSSVVVGAGPAHAVYFATYEAVKHLMGGNRAGVHHPLAAATSGACATIASDALMNPFDVIKQRMQIQNSSKMYRSMADCARYVYKTEGISAFYVSYPTTLSMTVPFTALQFLAYESISTAMNPGKKYDPFTHCMAGAVAGGFAAALTTPMDVIKTMLQTRGTATDPELRSVNGFVAGCKLMYRREGLRGFFKGVRPRVVTTMPSTAICWSAYEASKAYFIRTNSASS